MKKGLTTVQKDGWVVSITNGFPYQGRFILNVSKPIIFNEKKKTLIGNSNGRKFSTREEAWQFALERGYLEIYSKPFALKEMIRKHHNYPKPTSKKYKRRIQTEHWNRLVFK